MNLLRKKVSDRILNNRQIILLNLNKSKNNNKNNYITFRRVKLVGNIVTVMILSKKLFKVLNSQ